MRGKKVIALALLLAGLLASFGACSAQISSEEKITEINRMIEQEGQGWTAGETSVSSLSAQAKESLLMETKPETSDYGKAFVSSQTYSLPTEVLPYLDWRNKSGNWATPVRNQGGCGSCWAFAAAGVIESSVNIGLENPDYDLDLSEQDLVSCSKAGSCQGGQQGFAISYAKSTGLVKEACFPYAAANLPCNKCANPEVVKVLGYSIADDLSGIREALNMYGPVTVYMAVYADFFYYAKGVYRHAWGGLSGFHAISIAGYNDSGSYWICKNSWGDRWGEKGYFRINYSENVDSYDKWVSNRSGTFFLDESYVITSTDIDMDGIRDDRDNCPYIYNPSQEDSDNNSIGDACDCMPFWVNEDTPCLEDDSRIVAYADSNSCGKAYGLPADNGTHEFCDFCQPAFICSASSCMQDDKLRCASVIDAKGCHNFTNSSSDLYSGNFSEFQAAECDYCSPDWSCSKYSCQANDTANCAALNDSRSCFARTGLETDLLASQTDFPAAKCDFCAPNWTGVLAECLPDDSSAVWFNDSNSCYKITGLASDNQRPKNSTMPYTCDYNKDGLIGKSDAINTTLKNLEVLKENSTVKVEAENATIIEFIPRSPVNLADLYIEKQGNHSMFSYMLIKGIGLSENATKTIYMERMLNGTGICIKDAELNSIDEMTLGCAGDEETWLACPGSKEPYVCEIVENDSFYKISGLSHSGIREQQTYCGDGVCNGAENCSACSQDCGICPPSCGDGVCNGDETCSSCSVDCGLCPSPPAPSGGGPPSGGSGNYNKETEPCSEDWFCSAWLECIGSIQTRVCSDASKCGTAKSRPEIAKACQVFNPETEICAPGEFSCSGQSLKVCSDDGLSWNAVEECEHVCSGGACSPAPEIPGHPQNQETARQISGILSSLLLYILLAIINFII